MLRHILILYFVLHCTAGVPLAQSKEQAKAQEMDSLFEDDINKRSKEVIMFGNQQNKGKATQAGMIDSDLVPQDSNGNDDDDDENKNEPNENHKSDDQKSVGDQSQSDEIEGNYEALNHGLNPVQGNEYSTRPYKEDVEDILPELTDASKSDEGWGDYRKLLYYFKDSLSRRRKRSMDRRYAMKKRNYVAAREHLLKRRSEKRSRFRRDLDEEELVQLINMLNAEKYPYDRKRRQYFGPESDEDDDDDDDNNREGFTAEELNGMFNKDAGPENYNPYYYSTDDNDFPLPNGNYFDKDDDSDESDDDDNRDDWEHMGPARQIDMHRRSEFFYPPADYRFMMIPGQKRRLPMHEEESEGLWGSFDDKRAVKKKKRGYHFGEENDEEDEDENDDEKLNQIRELASYMNSHNRDYRSFR